MDATRVRVLRQSCAPKSFPCPHCGTPGRRKDNDARYRADPDLAQVLGMLTPERFDKMMTFLHRPAAKRVRTNNHVERTNRRLRHFEKVRYKWRRRTIVRFIVLALERWHCQRIAQKRNTNSQHQESHARVVRKQVT